MRYTTWLFLCDSSTKFRYKNNSWFCVKVAKKIRELMADYENMNIVHESHDVFRREQDEQLVQWMNRFGLLHILMYIIWRIKNVQPFSWKNICLCRRPDDWTLSAGGSGTIYGWGHNHRGQLGGIEGAKVKVPTPCEALATLRPVQLIGGEQTLFAVTADGKVTSAVIWIEMLLIFN